MFLRPIADDLALSGGIWMVNVWLLASMGVIVTGLLCVRVFAILVAVKEFSKALSVSYRMQSHSRNSTLMNVMNKERGQYDRGCSSRLPFSDL